MKERPILFNTEMVQAILEGRKTQTRRILKNQPIWLDSDNPMVSSGWAYKDQKGKFSLESYPDHLSFAQAFLEHAICQFGDVGDQLWVRETWAPVNSYGAPAIAYKANSDMRELMEDESFLDEDGAFNYEDPRSKKYLFSCWADDLFSGVEGNWKPSIHMPRWVCRLVLEITNIRVERLNNISEADAIAEGVEPVSVPDYVPVDGGYTKADRAMWKGYKNNERAYRDTAKDSFMSLWQSVYGADSWTANPWVWVVEFKVVEGISK